MNNYFNGMLGGFGGMRVVTDVKMVEQFRRPRSKSKRIQAKWRKNPKNFRPSKTTLIDKCRGIIYCHPVIAEELRRKINAKAY